MRVEDAEELENSAEKNLLSAAGKVQPLGISSSKKQSIASPYE
jgi:hypothetical protein